MSGVLKVKVGGVWTPVLATAGPHHASHEPGGSDALTFSTGILERGRTVPLGEWTSYTPTLGVTAGTISLDTMFNCAYTLFGRTIVIAFYLQVTLSGTPTVVTVSLPSGVTALGYSANVYTHSQGASVAQTTPGSGALSLYYDSTGTTPWVSGVQYVSGTAIVALT